MVSLHGLVDKQFGVRTRAAENRGIIAITTTPAIVLRNDSARLAFTIINLGQSDVFIRPNTDPSATVGIRIGPNGGTASFQFDEDYNSVGLEWRAVTAAGTSTLYTLEILIEPGRVGEE